MGKCELIELTKCLVYEEIKNIALAPIQRIIRKDSDEENLSTIEKLQIRFIH